MSNTDWSITLTPHRSLSREGFIAVIVLVAGINLIVGLTFYSVGAWPIVGFLGLDVLAIWWAFRQNFRDGQEVERIITRGDDVTLMRLKKDGSTSEAILNRRWLRVEIEYDAMRELVGRLTLCSRGERHEIAAFLGADERLSLAKALRQKI
jgi:uncharacterized membrane protein